jgi:hypothetical protein
MTRLSVGTLRSWRSVGVGGPESFKLESTGDLPPCRVEKWLEEAQ